jgi:serine/threonine-protein kinase
MNPTRDLEEAGPQSIVDRRYFIRREIARGGVGAVFEAEHVITRAKVAVKTLMRPALDHRPSHMRLMREARVLGAIRHPYVAYVQDAGYCPKHGPYLVLDMIDGRPLDGILAARRRLPVGQAVAIVAQLCEALESVHRCGVVHRDVKPSNILIRRTPSAEQVVLIDFGIAKVGPEDDITEEKITKSGEILGTVEYMAPEQIMGTSPIDARTDVYGAGIVLYECLTGDVPFSGSPTALIAAFLSGQRPPPIRAVHHDVPLELEAAVRKALEIDPGHRFASAKEFATACSEAVGGVLPALDLLVIRDDRMQPSRQEARADASATSPGAAAPALRRRQFPRAPYVAPVRIVAGLGKAIDGRTEDISEGGVLVVASSDCERDAMVKLRLPLPASGRVVSLDGIVRWTRVHRYQRALGVEFVNAPEDVRLEIRAYVAAMSGAPTEPPKIDDQPLPEGAEPAPRRE